MKSVSLLGSTGSIGVQSLDIIRKNGMRVTVLAAKSNADRLIEQALEFKPKAVCIYCSDKADYLRDKLSGSGIGVLSGMDGLCEAACMDGTDILINSVVGMVGLPPALAAIDAGIDIA